LKSTIKLILLFITIIFSLNADEIQLTGTLRDFHASHPDFERYEEFGTWNGWTGLDRDIVKEQLGDDKKPVYKGSMMSGWTTTKSTTNSTNFNQLPTLE